SGMTKLQTIYISDNHISDLSPLSGLPELETIWCNNNDIYDISPLMGMTSIRQLDIYYQNDFEAAIAGLEEFIQTHPEVDVR
ncbi:MAG: leucine-rich repeat domain-containing protein, partial [Oscillospiraceae bacterium]